MEGPMTDRHFRATRWSRPIFAQGRVSSVELNTRMILGFEYWETSPPIGTILKSALQATGTNAVVVMSTGRVTHQNTIQRETPTAWAPFTVKAEAPPMLTSR